MKKYFLLIISFALLFAVNGFGQYNYSNTSLGSIRQTSDNKQKTQKEKNTQWIELKATSSIVNYEASLKNSLKINDNNELHLLSKETDGLGITHRRYKQYANNIPIEGASFIVHKYTDGKTLVNGLWVNEFNLDVKKRIERKKVLEIIKDYLPSDKVMGWEKMPNLKEYQPKIELVWFDKKYGTNPLDYRLTYKVDVVFGPPFQKYRFFIDAKSSKVIHKYNILYTNNIEINEKGMYNGEVKITIDSVSTDKFELRDFNRIGDISIETYDYSGVFPGGGTASICSSSSRDFKDSVAIDCHWGAEKAIDYFYTQHQRIGINGRTVIVNVHVLDEFTGEPMANAFWNSFSLNLGDGDPSPDSKYRKPFTSLAIVAHELTHGVTENTANLIYDRESGAINESMSDIFGISTEFFYSPSYNWTLGDEIGPAFRFMNDPNKAESPAFYGGQFWNDNNDVHINSSIGNLWYYYLVEGGEGRTETNIDFNIQGLGFEVAGKIVYRALTKYLTESSDYADFRLASLKATEDMFGKCSEEWRVVNKAWSIVGVGDYYNADDAFNMNEITSTYDRCGLGDENLSVSFYFTSCELSVPKGSIVKMNYSIDGGQIVTEDFAVDKELEWGDVLNYSFTQKMDLSVVDTHQIVTWIEYLDDKYLTNDTLKMIVNNNLQQNNDFAVNKISSPIGDGVCGLSLNNPVIQLEFLGCDSIAAGTELIFNAKIADSEFQNKYKLNKTLYYQDVVGVNLNGTLDVDDYGIYELIIDVESNGDPFIFNNSISKNIKFLPDRDDNINVGFDSIDEFNQFSFTSSSIKTDTFVQRPDIDEKDLALVFSGNFPFSDTIIGVAELDSIWTVNEQANTELCICVDATEWDNVYLNFDLLVRQNYIWDIFLFGEAPHHFSNMRILVDKEPVSRTFSDEDENTIRNHTIDLSNYAGKSFELCFQVRAFLDRAHSTKTDFYDELGDFVLLDNISITRNPTSSNDIYSNDNTFQIFPNPTNSIINILISSEKSQQANLQIYNINGQNILNKKVSVNNGENIFKIDFNEFKSGFYYIKSTLGNDSKIIKFIKN